jgi:serine/threonine protein kinase
VHESVKAATYVSDDLRVPRSVAIKLLPPTLTRLAHYRDEFQRQAQMAARLQHPHICQVIDFGETALPLGKALQTVSYLCTEFMEGGNLAARLEAQPPPPLAVVSSWIKTLAAALQHAHDHGVIHGDLKPACIVFDSGGSPYLSDFALACSGESGTRSLVGTPDFLAPEQWQGEKSSNATDQYSLAVLAYIMVTGSRPYEGQSDPMVRDKNFRVGPVPAHQEAQHNGREGVTPAVSKVLSKALSRTPADRYSSVGEFAAALAEAITNPQRRGSEPCLFMSYQRESSGGWATLLAHTLKKQGWSVFIDNQAQDGAPQIPDRLRNEIAACDVFICMLAPGTLSSRWVRQEIEIACQYEKPMVPILQEGFRPKDQNDGDANVQALLSYEGVPLLDRSGIYLDAAMDALADRVRKLLS